MVETVCLHTIGQRFETARRWLFQNNIPDGELGSRSNPYILEEMDDDDDEIVFWLTPPKGQPQGSEAGSINPN